MVTGPIVSCLCVTEDRAAFLPWLLWNFDKQSWPARELVIVDSSGTAPSLPERDDVRLLRMPLRATVGRKRNRALAEARGELVTWFDDDDWQHPEKLARLVAALAPDRVLTGSTRSWFVDLARERACRYSGREIVFNSAGFRRAAVAALRFDELQPRATDTHWLRAVRGVARGRSASLDGPPLSFWLCHDRNLSNPAAKRSGNISLEAIARELGRAWGETSEQLRALRARLGHATGAVPAQVPGERESAVASSTGRAVPERRTPGASVTTTRVEPGEPTERPASGAPPAAAEPLGRPAAVDPSDLPPVSAVVKVTVLDAPFIGVMIPHMLAQARFRFADRLVVVDRRREFEGKYVSRPRATEHALRATLDALCESGEVDRVLEVDYDPDRVASARAWFEPGSPPVPTHASTGGPIYPTLFGLDAVASDYVVQFDADVLFHTGPESWVDASLRLMMDHPDLWLMMTHPGPPAGPGGRSLKGSNARRAQWDPAQRIWRFRSATTRYFLCDRRRLRGRIPVHVAPEGGCAPLEQCISVALQRNSAWRGNLCDRGSWHLHAHHHGDPFPDWAPGLARAVAAGLFPAVQRGVYDLRLDRATDRSAWRTLLEPSTRSGVTAVPKPAGNPRFAASSIAESAAVPAGGRTAPTPRAPATGEPPRPRVARSAERIARLGPVTGPSKADAADTDAVANAALGEQLAVVIPIRDRAGRRIQNCLTSLRWQPEGAVGEIILVSHGSRPEIDSELAELCARFGASLLRIGSTADPWNKPYALNVGIQSAASARFVMTMDADMILAPGFAAAVHAQLTREPKSLVLCRSSDLPQSTNLPTDPAALRDALPAARRRATLRGRKGSGGIQAAERAFFMAVRGYDEDMLYWGAMDNDMLHRAEAAGLKPSWIDEETYMLHQWHMRKATALRDVRQQAEARRFWERNHALAAARASQVERNLSGWGLLR